MTSAKVSSSIGLLVLCLWSLAASAQQQLTYSLTFLAKADLNDPANLFSIRTLNERGELLGSRSLPDGSSELFIWRDGTFFPLDQFDDTTVVSGFNDRSELAGTLNHATANSTAFIARRNRVLSIAPPPDETVIAVHDLNNRRQLLLQTAENLYVWRAGGFTLLEPLPGSMSTLARDLNNRGVALGNAGITLGSQPVVWDQDGSVLELAIPEGAVSAGAEAINDDGIVVGGTFIQRPEAVLWQERVPTILPSLNATEGGDAADVNDREVVVGRSFADGPSIATLWRHRLPVDLNARVASDDPARPFVHLTWAVLINDRGEIVALAQDSRDAGQDLTSFYLLRPQR